MAELVLRTFQCKKCGYPLSKLNPFVGVIVCPMCKQSHVNPTFEEKSMPVPERIIPFKADEEAFSNALIDCLVNADFVPKDIFDHIRTNSLIKTYLPMYLYEGKYQASWSCEVAYEATEIGTNLSGDRLKEKKVKKYQPTSGTSQGNFAFLCLAHEDEDIPNELREFASTFPYHIQDSKPFDPAILQQEQDAQVLYFNADSDVVWNKYGDELVAQFAEERAKEQLNGQDIKNFSVSSSYDLSHKGRNIMVPFWFVYYTYKDNTYYYMMDGLGEHDAYNAPVDQEEYTIVNKNETIKSYATWACLLAVILLLAVGFSAAFYYLIAWGIIKLGVNWYYNKQTRQLLDESRECRRIAAQKNQITL